MHSHPLIYRLQVLSLLIIEFVGLGLIQISFLELQADIYPTARFSVQPCGCFCDGWMLWDVFWIHQYCWSQVWDKLMNSSSMIENHLELFSNDQQVGWRTCCWVPLAWYFSCTRMMHTPLESQQWVDLTLDLYVFQGWEKTDDRRFGTVACGAPRDRSNCL